MATASRRPEDATPPSPVYEVFAVKIAERQAVRREHFHRDFPASAGDTDERESMPMDYFVWAIVGGDRTWVVDTGFGLDEAAARGRTLLRTTSDALASIGIDAASVADVIVTHLHYDHAGGIEQFPSARFHVQEREVAFATGRHMRRPDQRHAFTPRHIADFVIAIHDDRVEIHDGESRLAPGLTVHHVGGHTDGLQIVRVNTAAGQLVLASDASHYYENLEARRPFPIAYDVDAVLVGFDRLAELADPADLWIPGHDPEVLRRHPAAGTGPSGTACRLA